MNTLLDFMTRTKGIEYLLAITLIITFILFWQLLHYKGNGKSLAVQLLPVLVMLLAIGFLDIFVAMQSSTVRMELPPREDKILVSSQVLVSLYGPAWLNHDLHKEKVKDCKTCHHFSGENIVQCRECHGAAFDPKNLSKPGLAHVYHLRCIGCHMENRLGPTGCEGCHTKASIPPLTPAHPLTGIQKCLSCHGPEGIKGVTKVPADHAGAPDSVCQLCHKTLVNAVARAVRVIPHDINAQQGCLICHGDGIVEARKVPADHAGRTDETCLLCHRSRGKKISHENKQPNLGQ